MLEKKIAFIEKTHAEYLRENAYIESSIKMYRDGTMHGRDQEVGLRQDAENKKREAEWLREQACQDCVSGIDHRLHGNLAQANPILSQVEQLISEADQLDKEANEHIRQIEKNNKECQTLMAHVLANGRFRSDLMQSMEGFQTQLGDL